MTLHRYSRKLLWLNKMTYTKWSCIRKVTSLHQPVLCLHKQLLLFHRPLSYLHKSNKCAGFSFPSSKTRLDMRQMSTVSQNQVFKGDLLVRYVQSLHEEYKSSFRTDSVPAVLISSERRHYLQQIADIYEEYSQKISDRRENELLKDDIESKDDQDLMEAEIEEINQELEALKSQMVDMLLPEEKTDRNDVILEVSPGVGGKEAMLFTKEIFEMYQKYAQYKGWIFDVLHADAFNDFGVVGMTSASASMSGVDVYKFMKFESGVHRVQRVPRTETKNRIHTSTMTVAVLPQPTEIDIVINPKDLKFEAFRASGKGGQNVNKVDSAVRFTHIPTGVKAECREERTQHQNRDIAMKKLRAKLYQIELDKQTSSSQNQRKIQVGTAGRSEKIRTYNYAQDRITEHRIHHSMFDMESFLSGGQDLDEMIRNIMDQSQKEVLQEILDNFDKDNKIVSKGKG